MGAALIALALVSGYLDGVVERRIGLPGLLLALAATPITALAGVELGVMIRLAGARLPRGMAPASALAGLWAGAVSIMASNDTPTHAMLTLLTTLWFFITLVAISYPRRTDGAILAASCATLLFLYLGLIPGYYLVVRQHETAWTVMALILIVKSSDIGAYFIGTTIGRHKLIPWLSPGKTWEGLFGGMIAAGAVAACIAMIPVASEVGEALRFPLTPARSALLGTAIGLVGQAGDLTVSLFKRDSGLKDASMRLPGFGGVLDVVDSLILVGPVAHWMILLLR